LQQCRVWYKALEFDETEIENELAKNNNNPTLQFSVKNYEKTEALQKEIKGLFPQGIHFLFADNWKDKTI